MVKATSAPGTAKKKAPPRPRKAAAAKVAAVEAPPAKVPAAKKALTAKKAPSVRKAPAATKAAAAATPPAPKPRPRLATKVKEKAVLHVEPAAEAAIPEAEVVLPEAEPAGPDPQSQVVASKFASVEPAPTKSQPRPTLPSTYGESRLLLLVRDPQTLFAAWDVGPPTVEALRSRLGRRGFAVSTQTLRLTRSDGATSVVHAGKKARSRYIKIDGGPSFIAEIGFTTPAGRFEFVARSAPCFVPMGPVTRPDSIEAGTRSVLGYREARALARRGGLGSDPAVAAGRGRTAAAGSAPSAPRTLGGASDLYRR